MLLCLCSDCHGLCCFPFIELPSFLCGTLLLCDKAAGNDTICQHIEKANSPLEKCGNRHDVLRSENQSPEFLEKIERMAEETCGDFFLPLIYDEMQSNAAKNVAEAKKVYEQREEELKKQNQRRNAEYKTQAEETPLRQRRGSMSGRRPNRKY